MTLRILAALLAISGGLVIFLSYLPWLEVYGRDRPTIYHRDFDGMDVEALTGFGDGRLVAALGVFVILAAILAIVVPNRKRTMAPLISTGGFLIAGVALYDAFQVRKGSRYFPEFIFGGEVYDVDAGVALWLTLALGIIIGVIGATLLVLPRATRRAALKAQDRVSSSHSQQPNSRAESSSDAKESRGRHILSRQV